MNNVRVPHRKSSLDRSHGRQGDSRGKPAPGHELSYSRASKRVLSLVRAAERVFGTWGGAVQAAGFDYDAIRRYRKWSRDRIIARIRELHAQGADLSYRHVALTLDPPLAAAVAHGQRYASWSDALQAAGLDPASMARYRHWTVGGVQAELQRLHSQGVPLDRRTLTAKDAALLAAVYPAWQRIDC